MTITTYTIKEPTRSCLFLNDLTVCDHAYIDDKGCIIGGSFNPCFEVSGVPDPTEKVVVDFSSIKKSLKRLIDAHTFDPYENGFDHKVWIIEGYSLITNIVRHGDTTISIYTPTMTLDLPSDAVKLIPVMGGRIPTYSDEYIGAAFDEYLQDHLTNMYPEIDIHIKCSNTTNIHVPNAEIRSHAKMFRYVHGLKDSTSYGCNNIAHGHGSFIAADKNPNNILQTIADELDNTVFVRQDNVATLHADDDHTSEITIRYRTDRGGFLMTLDVRAHKVVILNTETTVEYLTQYIKTKFGQQMKDLGISTFYVSEGLSKGAIETL